MRYITTLFLILMAASTQVAQLKERDYQRRFCAGVALEIVTKSGTRADCVSKSHAIEVDWSKKWAEAIG